jgi:hypothetical protein
VATASGLTYAWRVISGPGAITAGATGATVTFSTYDGGQPLVLECLASNAGGTTPGQATLQVNRRWLPAASLGALSGALTLPAPAVDGAGNGLVAWLDGSSYRARRFDAASRAWQTTATLGTVPAGAASAPALAVNAAGEAVAMWARMDGAAASLYASWLAAGAAVWSSPGLVENSTAPVANQEPGFWAPPYAVALNAAGQAVALWRQQGSHNFDIFAATGTRSGWDPAAQLGPQYGTGGGSSPALALDAGGSLHGIWMQNLDGWLHIQGAQYGTAWTTPGAVGGSATNTHRHLPTVAAGPAGQAVAGWLEVRTGDHRMRASVFQGGTWGAAADPVIYTSPIGTDYQAINPQVSMDGAGKATAVWCLADSATLTYQIYAARYSGGAWSAPQRVDAATGTATVPRISGNAAGEVAVAFRTSSSSISNRLIACTRFLPGTSTWETPVALEPGSSSDAGFPAVKMDSNGRILVSWVVDSQVKAAWYR